MGKIGRHIVSRLHAGVGQSLTALLGEQELKKVLMSSQVLVSAVSTMPLSQSVYKYLSPPWCATQGTLPLSLRTRPHSHDPTAGLRSDWDICPRSISQRQGERTVRLGPDCDMI